MPRLPSLTARKVVRALKRAGFVEDRHKGSHLILIQPETRARTVVPVHQGRGSAVADERQFRFGLRLMF